MNRAFSLVELSIVLVILGLLTGGILAGKSLIRASELRSVTSDYQRYVTATHSFRDRFFGLPGDIANATSFWGELSSVAATCQNTASTSALTCDGDSDGIVEVSTSAKSREVYRYWQHLANAGLIEGTFTGTYENAATWAIAPGTNVPRSKIQNAGWGIVAIGDPNFLGWYLDMFPPSNSTHWLEFGWAPSTSNNYLYNPVLTTEEAWNIDSKIDDGMPGTGKITTFNPTRNSGCASSSTATTATYVLSNTSPRCTMMMGL